MVSFLVERDIRAPPEYVRDWWLDYSGGDATHDPRTVGRSVERLDERRVRVTTDSRHGDRVTTTDGIVTRTGLLAWVMDATVYRDGVIVSTMVTRFSVAPAGAGSELRAEFELHGKTTMWKLTLWIARGYLRKDRAKSLDSYVAALENDYLARTPATAPVPPGPATPASSR
jgi:hypothetical protein